MSFLLAQHMPWPENHCLVLKMNVESQSNIVAVPCVLINQSNDFWIAQEFLHPAKPFWQTLQKSKKSKRVTILKQEIIDGQQVVHVCCSSILHGTCSHHVNVHLPPAVFCEDGLIIEQEIADQLNLPVVNDEDFLQEQESNNLRNLSAYDTPVPDELLQFSNPSALTVYAQKIGIAALLYAVQARQYLLSGWRYLKSCVGLNEHE
jgi:hypothetical protein